MLKFWPFVGLANICVSSQNNTKINKQIQQGKKRVCRTIWVKTYWCYSLSCHSLDGEEQVTDEIASFKDTAADIQHQKHHLPGMSTWSSSHSGSFPTAVLSFQSVCLI